MIKMEETRLLITCCNQNGGLFEAVFKEGSCTVRKVLEQECRGIVKYGDGYIVASADRILLLDHSLDIRSSKTLDIALDLHGTAVYKDQLYVVETGRDSIGIYDLKQDLQHIGEIRFSPEVADTCHVNDLFIEKDRLFVSMFSYKGKKKGVIAEYSLKSRKLIKVRHKHLHQPHSIKKDGKDLYYCVSAEFTVRKNKSDLFKGLGYLRGMDVKGDMVYIGQSESRHIDKLLENHHNILFDCGVYVYNMQTKLCSFFHIPAGEIYQILAD
ncbi:hypothetical protein GKZ89_19015 [Bacillus mangrovi]|uniref:DUF4915 domain-containing protein n=1 Tax=Metabacillus mangrovi TaxID=1491830 RepID=A0A7X2S8A0_9BACI|nr:hypothetical protein [Metabacillus mangrovi]MTH55487.1 hypothetical protein [Metabacillus mangrovi]